jgi:hypothetical protein
LFQKFSNKNRIRKDDPGFVPVIISGIVTHNRQILYPGPADVNKLAVVIRQEEPIHILSGIKVYPRISVGNGKIQKHGNIGNAMPVANYPPYISLGNSKGADDHPVSSSTFF